jgi:hypothetical protein
MGAVHRWIIPSVVFLLLTGILAAIGQIPGIPALL